MYMEVFLWRSQYLRYGSQNRVAPVVTMAASVAITAAISGIFYLFRNED